MLSRTIRALTIAATAALVLAPNAGAAANLTSATQDNHIVSASWMLPGDETPWSIGVSADPSFSFADDSIPGFFADLGPGQTTFTATDNPLPGGLYYVSVTTTPTPDACGGGGGTCEFRYSNVLTVTIPSGAATLQNVTQTGGVVSAVWSLPAGVANTFIEIATSPAIGAGGFFVDVVLNPDLAPTQRIFTAATALPPGVYYVHIVTISVPFVYEFSNIVAVTVTAPGQSSPPPGPSSDKVLALGAVTASSSQKFDKLSITLNPGEAVRAKLSGTVSVPGGSKVYRFTSVSKSIGAGVKTKLSLRLPKKGKKAVKKALKRKKKLKAKLTLVITDAAGNAQTKKYTVRLKQ